MADSKPLVLVLGTLGTGKSTVLNRTCGEEGRFEAKDSVEAVTKGFNTYDLKNFTLLDTPGLGDPEMPLATWVGKLNASTIKGRPVALVLMVLKAAIRPTAQDKTNILIMQEAIEQIKPENVCNVITFVDENPQTYTIEREMLFLEKLFSYIEGAPKPKQENVFLFKGKSQPGVP